MKTLDSNIPSGCVIYTKTLPDFILEGDVPCKGDLDSVLLFFGEEISNIVEQTDISTLSGDCLDLPKGLSLPELTREKLALICEHEEKIQKLQDQLTNLNIGEQKIQIDLDCLVGSVDPCDNGNIYTLSQVLSIFSRSLCILKTRLTACCAGVQGSSGGSGTSATSGTGGVSGTQGDAGETSGSSGTSGNDTSQQNIAPNAPCSGIDSAYTITGTTPGDVIVVRATFSGVLQKLLNNFTRADLNISAPNGTIDFNSSPCYSDTASHPFSITSETTITAVGSSELVLLSVVVHNSNESLTSVIVTIVNVNGNDTNIFVPGCRGNSGTGGTC